MGSKMGAADPNYPKIQGLSRLSRLSYGIAARQSYSISDLRQGIRMRFARSDCLRDHLTLIPSAAIRHQVLTGVALCVLSFSMTRTGTAALLSVLTKQRALRSDATPNLR